MVDVGVRGFVPASLVERGYVADLNQYLDTELRLRVIELDRSKNKIVLSQKVILDEEYEAKRNETWESLEEGQTRHGIVRRITDFGAFVDLGGVDGLLHVSEIAWGRVEHLPMYSVRDRKLMFMCWSRQRRRKSFSWLKAASAEPLGTGSRKYAPVQSLKGKSLGLRHLEPLLK